MKLISPRHRLGAVLAVAAISVGLTTINPAGAAPDSPGAPAQDPGDGGISEHTCDGCEPPLEYQGGRVMDTSGPSGVTITPIFWAPDGYEFPAGYIELIEQYIADIAADSGKPTNVYSLAEEYSITEGENQAQLDYRFTAGKTIIDTNPYPDSGCDPEDDFTDCITDDQLRDELDALVEANDLVTDVGYFYPVFFPEPVETEDLDGSNSIDGYCGYHRAYDADDGPVVYGNEPFVPDGCGMGQSPNDNLPADGAINVLSHEIMEALTDPEDAVTWNDKTGHEIGDICAEAYGPSLGAADPSNSDTTSYNQEINGHRYYTQTEFSNAAFEAFGNGAGCQQSSDTASAAVSSPIGVMLAGATPNVLEADRSATADVEIVISAPDGSALEGDGLAYSTKSIDGLGSCGALSETTGTTDEDGFAKVTYTASTDDAICGIVVVDSMGGQAATAAIYQGTYGDEAPTAQAEFPDEVGAGGDPSTFDVTFTNPGEEDFSSAQVSFSVFPADDATDDVTAEQMSLKASFNGDGDDFEPVELAGSTVTEGAIQDDIDDIELDAGDTMTITFEMALDDSVSTPEDPSISLEAYLDLINPASGAGTNLADTLASDVTIVAAEEISTTSTGDGSSSSPWLLIVGAIVVLAVGTAVVVTIRRRNTGAA